MVFYGVASLLFGYLMFRSGYLPKILGALLALGGFGFVTNNLALVLAPAYASSEFLLPMPIAALSLTLCHVARANPIVIAFTAMIGSGNQNTFDTDNFFGEGAGERQRAANEFFKTFITFEDRGRASHPLARKHCGENALTGGVGEGAALPHAQLPRARLAQGDVRHAGHADAVGRAAGVEPEEHAGGGGG